MKTITFQKFIISISILLTSMTTWAQLDLVNIESHNKGVLLPRMSTADRTNINASEGMVIFNIDTQLFNYHDGTSWKELIGTGGPYGSEGPQGDPGQDVLGPNGESGFNGLKCWDKNGDEIFTPDEDTDGNGDFNVHDCIVLIGPKGETGSDGPQGSPSFEMGPDGPLSAQVFSKQVPNNSTSCLEFDEDQLNGRSDVILLHQSRQQGGFTAIPESTLTYQDDKWNVCAKSGNLQIFSFYDILILGNL